MTVTLTSPEGVSRLPGFLFHFRQSFPFDVTENKKSHTFYIKVSLFFNRITGIHPRAPAPLKRKYVSVSFKPKGPCHPGTCSLALSGTIKYKGLVLAELFDPLVHLRWILSEGSWNFLAASPPVTVLAHIYDDRIRTAHQFFSLLDRNSGNVLGVSRNRGRAENQQKYETGHHRNGVLFKSHGLRIN